MPTVWVWIAEEVGEGDGGEGIVVGVVLGVEFDHSFGFDYSGGVCGWLNIVLDSLWCTG